MRAEIGGRAVRLALMASPPNQRQAKGLRSR